MREVIAILQTGIILTSPIFFLVVLIVLWRVIRTTEATMAVAVHVKRQIEVLRGGGLAEGVRPTQQVQHAEGKVPQAGQRP